MKLLDKISQIITKINSSNKDKGHSSDKMIPTTIPKKKESNKVRRNRWGFPIK